MPDVVGRELALARELVDRPDGVDRRPTNLRDRADVPADRTHSEMQEVLEAAVPELVVVDHLAHAIVDRVPG